MKEHNPMHDADTRKQVSKTLLAIGHKPPVRGGNGTGMTKPEMMLSEHTGLSPIIVKTGSAPGQTEYPTHYKIDLGDEYLKLAVEVDGHSHGLIERKRQDHKKEEFLNGLGWTLLRFSNKEVMGDLEACAQMVMSTISKLQGRIPMS
jgi:hypothetical protein